MIKEEYRWRVVKAVSIVMGLLLLSMLNSFSANAAPYYDYDLDSDTEQKKNVLFISSEAPGSTIFGEQLAGIKQVLEMDQIQFDMEFMDAERIGKSTNTANFYALIEHKMKYIQPYDVLIVSGDEAARFAMNHRKTLFDQAPVVFIDVKDYSIVEKYRSHEATYFINGDNHHKETIALAKQLLPKATKIYGVFDRTKRAQNNKIAFLVEMTEESYDYEVIDLKHMGFKDFRGALNEIDEDAIVLFYSSEVDAYGQIFSFENSLYVVTRNAGVPMFSTEWDGMNKGILGGMMLDSLSEGRIAAEVTADILYDDGIVKLDELIDAYAKIYVDKNIIDYYKLDRKWVPESSVVINETINFWTPYKEYIIAIVIIVFIQLLVIIFMFRNLIIRKKTEVELHDRVLELGNKNKAIAMALDTLEERDQHIEHLVYYDELTGLNNRYGITEYIETNLNADSTDQLVIAFLDVDNFKNINDTFGHDIGDEVIYQTGERLKGLQSERVRLGRFGGDEFLIVIKNPQSEDEVEVLMKAIQGCFANLVVIKEMKFFLTVSVGIAIYPDHGKAQTDLIKKADRALYEAKHNGKNAYAIYESSLGASHDDKVLFQSAIKEAFTNNEFYLAYQPYYDLKSNRPVGFEALIRWESLTLGQVSPYKLVTNAEEMGLIVEIGEWILYQAFNFAKTIEEHSDEEISISINISVVQLMHQGFLQSVIELVETVGVNPKHINLEMTETILLESVDDGKHIIQGLRDYGFNISLDDFGTGYSSLSYFKNIPADILKVDKSFIDNIVKSDYDVYIVEAIINLAHRKGLKVIAEGVEDREQVEVLKQLNCDVIQGYYFDKPLSTEKAFNRLSKDVSNQVLV